MTIIKKSATVAYAVDQMYELVNDVDRYSEFVPYCKSSTVLSRTEDEVKATLAFAKGAFEKSFTTCNRLQPPKLVEIRLVDGPFKRLQGFWSFEVCDDAEGIKTRVVLHLDFEFSNYFISLAFGPIFNQIANMLVDVFCKRAEDLYGKD